jgi:hypothetical protein
VNELALKARAYWGAIVLGGTVVLSLASVRLALGFGHFTAREIISLAVFAILTLGAERISVPIVFAVVK